MPYRPIKLIEIISSEVELCHKKGLHNHLSEVLLEESQSGVEHISEEKKLVIKNAQSLKITLPTHSYLEIQSDETSAISGQFNYGRLSSSGQLKLKVEPVESGHQASNLLFHCFYLLVLMLVLSPVLGGIHALGYNSLHYLDWLGLIASSFYITWNGMDRVAKRFSFIVAFFSIFSPEIIKAFSSGDFLLIFRQEEWLENTLQVLTFVTLWKVGKYLKDHWFKSAML